MRPQLSFSGAVRAGDSRSWLEPREAGNVLETGPPGLGVLRREKLAELEDFQLQLPAFQLKRAEVKNERLM